MGKKGWWGEPLVHSRRGRQSRLYNPTALLRSLPPSIYIYQRTALCSSSSVFKRSIVIALARLRSSHLSTAGSISFPLSLSFSIYIYLSTFFSGGSAFDCLDLRSCGRRSFGDFLFVRLRCFSRFGGSLGAAGDLVDSDERLLSFRGVPGVFRDDGFSSFFLSSFFFIFCMRVCVRVRLSPGLA